MWFIILLSIFLVLQFAIRLSGDAVVLPDLLLVLGISLILVRDCLFKHPIILFLTYM